MKAPRSPSGGDTRGLLRLLMVLVCSATSTRTFLGDFEVLNTGQLTLLPFTVEIGME